MTPLPIDVVLPDLRLALAANDDRVLEVTCSTLPIKVASF
ncbi:hypothetical protein Q3H58_004021 [Pseudomonas psychrotolerans]|uniref:Uncharacterized protein n=1 Tax=Pseudomonas oryzihabitans TaxID=47885 RepID=A0AAJ2BLQ9_9PSED|nr:hypothetical protein [Pseudomonas psychrotolerans]MDR6357350.1 hypothetical protein [Pseudomonas psychrotolerans]